MYKITITDKYNLLQYVVYANTWVLVQSFNTIPQLKLHVKKKLPGMIVLEEIDEAIKFMRDTTHNTAEFGVRGLLTVSYYDESIEE